ncbi:hypothetical protein [Xenorhabdus japonica]|uniref:Predicted transcriptional regulator, contains an HTH and PUA-like domains n=1 Tax=Xenorhabdus japonica TaxID=53341 RepID=A0A1I5AVB6_9GAMM|nr:hypothetical protein [Xenorhabdus japonica]SFN66351.1 Predicted transcriptional regulator, contains an HTH and PUA-like domains [Xenorhabdus japonica]
MKVKIQKYNITQEDYIVLSLHDAAWKKVSSGEKKYEFRRKFRRKHTVAFIYVTTPVKAIKGIMLLGEPISGTARQIADIAEKAIPSNGKSVFDYFADNDFGLAIPIIKFIEIPEVSLDYLRKTHHFVAPQFYLKLDKNKSLYDDLISHIY